MGGGYDGEVVGELDDGCDQKQKEFCVKCVLIVIAIGLPIILHTGNKK